jgi:hypothetical protein
VPPQIPAAPAAAAAAFLAPLAVDPGMWLSMVNVKPPQLADLEVESMKKFILDFKRYAQRCPPQLLRRMQHFILEEHLEVIIENVGARRVDIMGLDRDDFIEVMLQMHRANSSRKWRQMVKNAKMGKSDLSLSTFTQYVEDFRFWTLAAGQTHALPDKEVAKIFAQGLKPEVFKEEILSRMCDSLASVINES